VTIFFRKLQKDGYGLEKFVLVTRGRTGSTAVIDELNKSRQLHVFQELFILEHHMIGGKTATTTARNFLLLIIGSRRKNGGGE